MRKSQNKRLTAGAAGVAALLLGGISYASTVPTLSSQVPLGLPNAVGGMMSTSYSGGVLSSTGVTVDVLLPGGGVDSMIPGGTYSVSAKVNSSGLADSAGGNLSIIHNGTTWFSSTNLVAFGTLNTGGVAEFEFEFTQGSFSQTGQVPAAGTLVDVIVNATNLAYASTLFQNSFGPVAGGSADTAPVAPLPASAWSGGAILAGLAGLGLRRRAMAVMGVLGF